jgi:hypothetical protein
MCVRLPVQLQCKLLPFSSCVGLVRWAATPPWATWMISRPSVISHRKRWRIVPWPLSDSYPLMSGSLLALRTFRALEGKELIIIGGKQKRSMARHFFSACHTTRNMYVSNVYVTSPDRFMIWSSILSLDIFLRLKCSCTVPDKWVVGSIRATSEH